MTRKTIIKKGPPKDLQRTVRLPVVLLGGGEEEDAEEGEEEEEEEEKSYRILRPHMSPDDLCNALFPNARSGD